MKKFILYVLLLLFVQSCASLFPPKERIVYKDIIVYKKDYGQCQVKITNQDDILTKDQITSILNHKGCDKLVENNPELKIRFKKSTPETHIITTNELLAYRVSHIACPIDSKNVVCYAYQSVHNTINDSQKAILIQTEDLSDNFINNAYIIGSYQEGKFVFEEVIVSDLESFTKLTQIFLLNNANK